ncbi:hypothetical protein [Streptoalloteichus hindustanus]|uniref:Uncharacterized protein n=1 Tax=Streptoalloteichus hindustanus TaxID=2017 RepID=A0A1M5P846_STRHI|nr:hypothetical protein [Streptoalloteichus hindustanus]SHG97867.1 hypothetical protein SAMN05444320_117103 [Streptoalloteichus hindustanus]
MIQLVTFGMFAVVLGGLFLVAARPMPELPVSASSTSLPRHALRQAGGGLSLNDLLRRGDLRRPRRSRRLQRELTNTPTENPHEVEEAVNRLRRIPPVTQGDET